MAKLTRVDAPVLTQAERIRANPHDGVLHIVGKLLDGMAKGNKRYAPWTSKQHEAAHAYLRELVYGTMGDTSALTDDQREIVRKRFTSVCHAQINALGGTRLPGQAQLWYEEIAAKITLRRNNGRANRQARRKK